MSHEGIRFVSAEEVLRDSAQAAAHQGEGLSVDAVTPLKVRVKKSEGTGVEIDWRDGHQSSWNFRWLRDACPCATCNAERETNGRATGEPKPKPHDPLRRGHSRRPLRPQLQMERRPPVWHLLLDLPAQRLPVPPLQSPARRLNNPQHP